MEADERDVNFFSWSALFVVTAVCSLLFTGALYLLDGRIPFFFPVLSALSIFLCMVNRLVIYLKSPPKEETRPEYLYRD